MAEQRVLPLALRPGDRLAEADGEWVVVQAPTSYRAGKMVRTQVKRADGTLREMTWPAQERIVVHRDEQRGSSEELPPKRPRRR